MDKKRSEEISKLWGDVHEAARHSSWDAFIVYQRYAAALGQVVAVLSREVNWGNFDEVAGKLVNPTTSDKRMVDFVRHDGVVKHMEVTSIRFVHSFFDGYCFHISMRDEESGKTICGTYLESNEWYKGLTAQILKERHEKWIASTPTTYSIPRVKNCPSWNLKEIVTSNPLTELAGDTGVVLKDEMSSLFK